MDSDELGIRLNHILHRVKNAALRDGIISHDEKLLIDLTQKGISQILEFLKEGGKRLQNNEREKVSSILEKLEDETISTAELDDYISDDEIAILGVLFSGIDGLFR